MGCGRYTPGKHGMNVFEKRASQNGGENIVMKTLKKIKVEVKHAS